ncbi:hypothetical protein C4K08_2094 [Pseudomonas chlororaphis subsp. aureofaciens]|nr:hypothetical protein C4K08_2094 [Pseudomonas chlororaphis subsp. aureofaciens]
MMGWLEALLLKQVLAALLQSRFTIIFQFRFLLSYLVLLPRTVVREVRL